MLRALEYPHWLMIAGSVLVAFGVVGLAFRRNRDTTPSAEIESKAKQDSSRATNRATKKIDWRGVVSQYLGMTVTRLRFSTTTWSKSRRADESKVYGMGRN